MEIWQVHPMFVHFPIALLLISSILFIIAALAPLKPWVTQCLTAAKWNFWIGMLMAVFAASSGLIAYLTVPNIDPALRMQINYHLISAVITVTVYVIFAFFLFRFQQKNLAPSSKWSFSLIIGIGLLLTTAYLGGDLVYKYGIGVDAIPATSKTVTQ